MEKSKFLTIIIVILVLLNIGTLGYLLLPKNTNQPPPLRGRGGPGAFIIKQLEFTPEQQQQFKVLRNDHHSQMVALSDSLCTVRDDYFNGLKTSTPDTALANLQAVNIARIEARMHQITFSHFIDVRKLCNPHQQELFDKFINEILHSMQSPGPGARPHRDRENRP
jgi:periplasmic protein CpxP/Spy